MEMKNILSLGERLKALIEKAEAEAKPFVSEAQSKADASIAEAKTDAEAKRLGISTKSLHKWKDQGAIPFTRRGSIILFNETAVDQALTSSVVTTTTHDTEENE